VIKIALLSWLLMEFTLQSTVRKGTSLVSPPTKVHRTHCCFHLTRSRSLLDDEEGWTLNEPLTRLSSYMKCSMPRTLDPSAQATSRLRVGGTTICSRKAPVPLVDAEIQEVGNRRQIAARAETTGYSLACAESRTTGRHLI
jgi:hypothetical protein